MRKIINVIFFTQFNILIFAQTGPGGVGNATTNNMWLSGDFGTFTDAGVTPATHGQQVQQWRDRSGNNRHASQATAANRPLFHNSSANGYPGLRFTSNLFIDGLSPGVGANSSYTYLIVFRDTATATGATTDGNGEFILDRPTATNELVSLKPVTGNRYFYQKRNNAGGGLGGVTGTTAINANTKIIQMRRNYNVNYQMFYNNVQEGGNLADADGATTPPPPRIGRHATTANGGIRGYINEFIIYNFALNAAQTIIVNNYLAAKYGLTLGANDVYTMDNPANGNFDHEVAGIGRVDASNIHNDAQGSGMVRINTPSGLGDNEFLMWGHNRGSITVNNTIDVDGTIIQSRTNRVWRVSEVGDVGTVTVIFDVSSFSPLVGTDLRLLIDRNGNGFFDNDVTPQTGTFGGSTITFTNVDFQDGDRFTLGSINVLQTPMPVEWLYFKANFTDNKVLLDWATASEQNSYYFDVEKSKNGIDWEFFSRKDAAGNSSTVKNYFDIDNFPFSGISYYRLKQVDFNGDYKYSDIAVVNNSHTGLEVEVYPNPHNNDVFYISINENDKVDIRLTDIQGKVVYYNSKQTNNNLFEIQTSGLSIGLYFLQIKTDFDSRIIKVVKN